MTSVGSFGNFNIESEFSYQGQGLESCVFISPNNGSMCSISIYLKSGSDYSDSYTNFGYYKNKEGSIALGSHVSHGSAIHITGVASGWYTIPLSGDIIANTSYWLTAQQDKAWPGSSLYFYQTLTSFPPFGRISYGSIAFDIWDDNPPDLTTLSFRRSAYATFSTWDIAFSQTLSESFTLGDSRRHDGSYWKTDTLAIGDNRVIAGSYWRSDTLTISDSVESQFVQLIQKMLTDTFSIAENIKGFAFSMRKTDNLVLSESQLNIITKILELVENLQILESMAMTAVVQKILTENLEIGDAYRRIVGIGDKIVSMFARILSDDISDTFDVNKIINDDISDHFDADRVIGDDISGRFGSEL
jgi:hypothetical protein